MPIKEFYLDRVLREMDLSQEEVTRVTRFPCNVEYILIFWCIMGNIQDSDVSKWTKICENWIWQGFSTSTN